MILERGNAALGVRVEIEFSEILVPIGDGPDRTITLMTCGMCGVLVYDPVKHVDFHYAIAARIGDGPPPGFAVGRASV